MENTKRVSTLKAVLIALYAACALPYLYYAFNGVYERYLVINYVVLLFLPLLLILLVFGDRLEAYGFDKGDAAVGRRLFLLLFLPTLVVLAIAARFPVFQNFYPLNPSARYSLQELLFWEIAYNGFYMFCWEFFFRGLLLFGLQQRIGTWAIYIQAIAFGCMHWGKPMPEFYASFLTGIALGWVALRARSFLPTFGLHAASAISFDLLVLAWSGHL